MDLVEFPAKIAFDRQELRGLQGFETMALLNSYPSYQIVITSLFTVVYIRIAGVEILGNLRAVRVWHTG
jgi:hypothetical protein